MSHREKLISEILEAFPERKFTGNAAPHDCLDCSVIRDGLTGATWADVPSAFLREHCSDLPLLSREAYVTFLPAWLREAVRDPEGEVPSSLMVSLREASNTSGFSPLQSKVIIAVARWVAENDGFGSADEVNIESVERIERVWGKHAA